MGEKSDDGSRVKKKRRSSSSSRHKQKRRIVVKKEDRKSHRKRNKRSSSSESISDGPSGLSKSPPIAIDRQRSESVSIRAAEDAREKRSSSPAVSVPDAEELRNIASYMDDRSVMVQHMFASMPKAELVSLVPVSLKGFSVNELLGLCAEELEGMSKKRIISVIEGHDLLESSDSSESEGSGDEGGIERDNEASAKRNRAEIAVADSTTEMEVTDTVATVVPDREEGTHSTRNEQVPEMNLGDEEIGIQQDGGVSSRLSVQGESSSMAVGLEDIPIPEEMVSADVAAECPSNETESAETVEAKSAEVSTAVPSIEVPVKEEDFAEKRKIDCGMETERDDETEGPVATERDSRSGRGMDLEEGEVVSDDDSTLPACSSRPAKVSGLPALPTAARKRHCATGEHVSRFRSQSQSSASSATLKASSRENNAAISRRSLGSITGEVKARETGRSSAAGGPQCASSEPSVSLNLLELELRERVLQSLVKRTNSL